MFRADSYTKKKKSWQTVDGKEATTNTGDARHESRSPNYASYVDHSTRREACQVTEASGVVEVAAAVVAAVTGSLSQSGDFPGCGYNTKATILRRH